MWGPDTNVWKISKSSVKTINIVYEKIGHGKLGKHIPSFFIETEIFSLQLWQILAIFFFLPIAFLFSKILSVRLVRIIPRIGKNISEFPKEDELNRLQRPALIAGLLILFALFFLSLNLTLSLKKCPGYNHNYFLYRSDMVLPSLSRYLCRPFSAKS